MRAKIFIILFLFFSLRSFNQTLNLNEKYHEIDLRIKQLSGELNSNFSFTIKPIDIGKNGIKISDSIFNISSYSPTIISLLNNKVNLKILPINFNINFSSHHPYNRNNGSMIPARGYQQLISAGLHLEIGPLSIQFKPEHVYAQNKDFDGFWEGHNDVIWAKRYFLWNSIDMPEKFGDKTFNKSYLGQSNIKLNFKGLSFGISSENLWWGPSIRNSIMMSNHAKGFNHISFNTTRPISTKIGNFEWQLVSGRLESSGFTPPGAERTYNGSTLYVPKINQNVETDDWRYFQGLVFTYSPKWINGLSIGFIRWAMMYSALVEGRYLYFMPGNPTYFPIFSNLFRSNDKYPDYEHQTDQAMGVFFRWLWEESNAEIYAEFYYNDSKQNLRDLFLDSDHSRAYTLGFQKLFKTFNKDISYLFSWEKTQLEQTASRSLRNAGSWYRHIYVFDGYTNRGEVLGAGIGPGSNSQYFSLTRISEKNKIGVSFEIIDQDNDFFHEAFASAGDSRRHWKDFNIHINFSKKYKNLWLSSNLMYSRSLNYQWELENYTKPYYNQGKEVNNIHIDLKLTFPLDF